MLEPDTIEIRLTLEQGAETDVSAQEWVRENCAGFGWPISVRHGSQADATVPANDLVRTQGRLPDGRLVRVDHASPHSPGGSGKVFVTVERDLSEPRPTAELPPAVPPVSPVHIRELLGKERLLTLWFEGDNLERMSRDRRAGAATLTIGEVTLFTRPSRTMSRPPGAVSWVEVDGLAYWFKDSQERMRDGFSAAHRGNEQALQSDFDYFEQQSAPRFLAGFAEEVEAAVQALRAEQAEADEEVQYERMRG